MQYEKINNLLGWLVFAIATFTYVSTLEPTTSFWDCGEYIATSYKLEVGHPPGAPTFLLIARVFSMFASPENVAYMVNMLSGLCSAGTILFLFWTISALGRKLISRNMTEESFSNGDLFAIFGSAFVGSLAYTFSDTFWFSAVEGEVYSMSSLLTAITFWAILKWERIANEPQADRWLILIAYLIGLSIGIHLLNLLAIPAVAYVIYFRKFKTTPRGIAITGVLSVFILGAIQNIIIPQVVNIAAKFEYGIVNTFGLPFHSGSVIFVLLLSAALCYFIYFTRKKHKPIWNTVLLAFVAILIGYSSFALIMVRSNANTPIDENNPENLVNLLAYLNREQYGDFPLAYGQYFNSPLDPSEPYKDGDPIYYPDKESGRYELGDSREGSVANYADEFKGIFPRMWSPKGNHVSAYKEWSDFEGKPIKFRNGQGQMETINKPTFGENLRFFMRYQVGWMYFRYFMWNFAGRQNDTQGHGSFLDGNWLSGMDFIDEPRIGNQDEITTEMATQKARNKFYMIPLVIGIIGLIFHFRKDPKYAWVVSLLFLFTGLAIVVYLNQYPYQPRERDYAYAGSFYAFAIWIGLGVMALYDAARNVDFKELGTTWGYGAAGAIGLSLVSAMFGGGEVAYVLLYVVLVGGALMALMSLLGKYVRSGTVQGALATILCFTAPFLMAKDGWDDHDRSGRYTARDIAKNYLDSCEENAILFTNGDNDTFPLWYLQEVEGYRTDVRIVNLTLASTDWFIDMIKRKAYEGEPVKLQMEKDDYRMRTREYLPIVERNASAGHINVDDIVDFVLDEKNMALFGSGRRMNYMPTRKFRLPVDKNVVFSNGTVDTANAHRVVDALEWEISGAYILRSELVMLDLLAQNNWERPIYFANTMPRDSYFGLEQYMQHEGFAYRLVPYKTRSDNNGYGYFGEVHTDIMYHNMMEEFRYGGMENPDIFLDENNLRFVTNLRLNFSRLANALHEEGDNERAIKALDKCVEMTVNSNTPIDITLLQMTELYYKLGENEKANELSRMLVNAYDERVKYFNSLGSEFRQTATRELGQAGAVINQIDLYLTQYQQTDLKAELQPVFDANKAAFNQMQMGQ